MKSRISRPIPRREFLRLSATAAVGVAASGLIEPSRLLAAGNDTLPLLSIGFAAMPEPGTRKYLADAGSMLMSDGAFLSHRAEVRIAGSGTGARSDVQNGSIVFDVVYPVLSRKPEDYPHFNAWSLHAENGVRTVSNGVRFSMPVTAKDGLQFLIHRQDAGTKSDDPTKPAAPSATQQSRVSLSLASGDGPKLQRGVYVIALRESAADRAPYWQGLVVENNNGHFVVPNIAVSHLILTVDYAADEPIRADKPRAVRH
jgi:hypothetical protein